MWDEDAEDEESYEITCDVCGKNLETANCSHVLIVVDRTFGDCEGGHAYDLWKSWYERVQVAFAAALKGDRPQTWAKSDIRSVWEAMIESEYEDPASPTLPFREFTDLVEELLTEAGGSPYIGTPMSEFGGRYESEMLLMFAEEPAAVCKTADEMLTAWLLPKPPRRGRRQKP